METAKLQYHLPEELIAQQALPGRADSRLMVLDRSSKSISHKHFRDIIDYLEPGDCLVVNESRVVPARFYLRRASGAQVEGLFLRIEEGGYWEVMLKNAGRVKDGERLAMVLPGEEINDKSPEFKALGKNGQGYWLLEPPHEDFQVILEEYGSTPLPPYIRREKRNPSEEADRKRYQTVFASQAGSVAAPTAGLHFEEELLKRMAEKGVRIAKVTLHVGPGTFKPVDAERLEDHRMHSEWYRIDDGNAAAINEAIAAGKRVVAVGTTAVRTLETCADANGRVTAGSGWTDIFIMPGYEFKIVKAMVTNFHLPGSTLLALVSAFYGLDETMAAYNIAVQEKYRFYSYGDAMVIV